MPGLVDFVSTPANGATKTLKTTFPYLYTGQVKQKHEKLHQDIMQWKWAALLSVKYQKGGNAPGETVLPLLHRETYTYCPKQEKKGGIGNVEHGDSVVLHLHMLHALSLVNSKKPLFFSPPQQHLTVGSSLLSH